jgi:hypothetical protein
MYERVEVIARWLRQINAISYVGQRHLNEEETFRLANIINFEGLLERRNRFGSIFFVDVNEEVQAKKCTKCEEIKLLKDFAESKKGLGKRSANCKVCDAKEYTERRAKKLGVAIEDLPNPYYSYPDVVKIFEESGCTLLETEYKNSKTPMRFICSCGNYHKVSITDFHRGTRCRECGNAKRADSQKFSYEEVVGMFEDSGCILLETEYINANTKMKYICSCGNTNPKPIRLGDFRDGKRCRQCGIHKLGDILRHDYETVYNLFEENGCKLLETSYKGNKVPMKYVCSCGNPSKICYDSFKRGNRCRKCAVERTSGENHYNYNHEKTFEERLYERKYPEYFEWRKQVFERDDYTCQCCGSRGSGSFNAHHLDGYNWCKERRTDVSNGVLLCETCHADFHSVHGYGDNTEEQYDDWLRNKRNQDAI